tara:strand:- start:2498 stop:3733 length:1236 start_codon:yes stop_codon:yes gene_type:complete
MEETNKSHLGSRDLTKIPFDVYTDEKTFQEEYDNIFRGPTWSFLGMESQLKVDGAYFTTEVSNISVVVVRSANGIGAFVNRCIHRGSLLCLESEGVLSEFSCIYHGWTYSLEGALTGVAFERGVNGDGGMPADFDKTTHHLEQLRVANYRGLIFGTFSKEAPEFNSFLGPEISPRLDRVLYKTPVLLGKATQVMHNNWKLYIENTKDSYHASILHTFFTTFKLNRLTQSGGLIISESGANHISYSKRGTAANHDGYDQQNLRANLDDFTLSDPSILNFLDEFNDGISLQILTIFPTTVVHQINNSLAVRQVIPRSEKKTDVVWWYYGFEDDSNALSSLRQKQINLVGPAGFISMEDGAVGAFVQKNAPHSSGNDAIVCMGGRDYTSSSSRVSEAAIRGFWSQYNDMMHSRN